MRVKAALLIISILIIITAANFFLNVCLNNKNLTKTMEKDFSVDLNISDELVSTKIHLLISDASAIAESINKANSPVEITNIMAAQVNESPEIMALTVLNREGIVASYGEPIVSTEEHRYVQKAFEGSNAFSSTRKDDKTGELVIFLFIPTERDHVLGLTMRGMIFTDFLSKYQLWQNGNIFVVDDEGTIIAHYHHDMVQERYNFIEKAKTDPGYKIIGDYFKVLITSDEGKGTYTLEGLNRLVTHKRLSYSEPGWSIAFAVYANDSPMAQMQKGLLFSSLIFLVIGIIASIFISGLAVRPFNKIEDQNRRLTELNETVQAASEAKSRFLAKMSHEMRTPLNAIIGLSELTLDTGSLCKENHSNLEKISNAGITLLSTVNNILDISKIETGKFELVPVKFDIPNLINETITQSILHIGEKRINFVLEIDENLPTHLYGDDLRIKQVLNNLMSNAFKYTNEGTVKLSIHCTREGDAVWLIIRVSDTGMGIRSGDIGKLFNDYIQMNIELTRNIEGTGLGLSITKMIAGLMDGSITVESEYGKGSVFTARLKQKFVTDSVIGAEIANSLKNFQYFEEKRRRNSHLKRIRLPYARVLVVDDVPTNLDVAKGMMKLYGMQIDCVMSGQEAIDAIRDEKVKYNAVFMDHMMPGIDGIEAARIIREEIGTEYAKTVPMIAFTANAIVGNEEMFLNKGFQAFLSKPLEVNNLDLIIQEWIRDEELEKTYKEKQIIVDGQKIIDVRGGKDRRIVTNRRCGIDRRSLDNKVLGIDMNKGLMRFGGNMESYLQVLRSYMANTPPLVEKIKSINQDTLAEYAIIVHGIKGSSRGICADLVGNKAEALEKAAKAGNIDFVIANNANFIADTEKVLTSLEEMFTETAAKNSKPSKDKPDREILIRLLTSCKAYDMDGVDEAMTEIEKYEYNSDDGLTIWLQENVDQMNFEQIIEKLSVLTA